MGTIRIRTLQAFLAASLVILGSLPAIANPPRGFFVTHCGFSHSLRDDPIMLPGAPGASHRHEFFGSDGRTRAPPSAACGRARRRAR